MPLIIPDETLKHAGLSEREMKIEIACRLFDAGKLSKPMAGRLAGLSRVEFEDELLERGLALIHIDEEYVRHELEMIRKMPPGNRRGARGGA